MKPTKPAQRYVCIHGHFYQPPRENPWLEEIEPQDSAYPYPNWNQRILAECYQTNAASRLLDGDGRITKITNNYARISFNFGPTLLSWMEAKAPDVYQAILDADADSRERFGGHGSALAQPYNHMIMPLAIYRDKVTQVRWGIRDFQHRFGRDPEGMWLPETAVDTETLEVLASEGIRFTILAPHQASRVRDIGSKEWRDVSGDRIDPGYAYRANLPNGKQIDLFFYDGPISRAVAFEHLLSDGQKLADRLLGREPGAEPLLIHMATDGETFGHHHRFGEMALTYALQHIEKSKRARLTNYGEFLELHPPTREVEIAERTAWSCAHGVERWRSDCGCQSGANPGWKQAWRAPLREALDDLRDKMAEIFETEAETLLRDPWAARDAYIDVILQRSPERSREFVEAHAVRTLDDNDRVRTLQLLETQRNAMLMFTSCGWFFDDISGTEAVQILRYAGRAIELAERLSTVSLEPAFLEKLVQARSNIPREGDGQRIYENRVRTSRVDLRAVAAHHAVQTLFQGTPEGRVYCYQIEQKDLKVSRAGRARLAVGSARVSSLITGSANTYTFGALHYGDHNLSGGVRVYSGTDEYRKFAHQISEAFARADLVAVQRELDRQFPDLAFSLRSLFRADRDRVMSRILEGPLSEAELLYFNLYENHAPLMRYLKSLDLPLPKPLQQAAKLVLNVRIRRALDRAEPDLAAVGAGIEAAERLDIKLDFAGLGYLWAQTLEKISDRLMASPGNLEELKRLKRVATLAANSDVEVNLWHVQNECYQLLESDLPGQEERAAARDGDAVQWVRNFKALCKALRIKVPEKRA